MLAVLGYNCMVNALGSANCAMGTSALSECVGNDNTVIGSYSTSVLTSGANNVAMGKNSLSALTTGSGNVAVGTSSGSALTTGSSNLYASNAGVASESGKIRIGTAGTHNATYISGIHMTSGNTTNQQYVTID